MYRKYLVAILSRLEIVISKLLGFGSGATSIDNEIDSLCHANKRNIRLAIDVGGNVGKYTKYLMRKCPGAVVHIFEPSSVNYVLLKNEFLDVPSVIINKYALSDESSNKTLYSDFGGSGLGSLVQRDLKHFDLHHVAQEVVETMVFDDYWHDVLHDSEIDLIKLDIEGHELSALHGMKQAMHKVGAVQFEFGGCNIDSRTYFKDFYDFFLNYSFTLYRISPLGLIKINSYSEALERFTTSNYLALKEL